MKLYLERSGTGPPLVLWHGWGLNLRIFDELRAALAADFEVIAVDLPGHGASKWPAGMDGEAQLSALLETVPSGAALLGWSLGGQFALRASAYQAPGPHRDDAALYERSRLDPRS
jgi:pimeloyl-[acyl-carrier protein] methyl ester esterase